MNKKKKCDVFTEDNESKLMASFLNKSGTLLDPSVGNGNLLKYLDLDNYEKIKVYDIEQEYLDEIPDRDNMEKVCNDFLKFSGDETYDNIILNAPYTKIQELGEDYVKFIRGEFPLLEKGNIDLYQAFILKSLKKLSKNGVLVSIHPNSLLKSKAGKPLMNYLIKNRYIDKIIDYKSEKKFPKIDVYVCIMVLRNNNTSDTFMYNDEEKRYTDISDNSIFLNKNDTRKTLGDYIKTSNGIATLRDKIFIHKTKMYEEPCWREIYKVSKDETKWIIFPYVLNDDSKYVLQEETVFKKNNPETYKHLLNNKEELLKRDNGKKKKYKWFEYGRSQGISVLNEKDEVLYISTMIPPENFKVYKKSKMLFSSGIYISLKDDVNITIDKVKEIIENNRDFVYKLSSYKGKEWYSLSSTTLKNIRIDK